MGKDNDEGPFEDEDLLGPAVRFQVLMTPDEALKFGTYLRALAASLPDDGSVSLEEALDASGARYEVLINDKE